MSATAGNFQVTLDWTAVSGATRYWVFRSEGHAGCNFGKALIAETTGLSYVDTQVANGRTYYYNVVPAGASSACYGRAGACVSATPDGTPTPDFGISCSPSSVGVLQGGSANTTCTVTSTDGFTGTVDLSCNNLPAGVTCSYNPNPVTAARRRHRRQHLDHQRVGLGGDRHVQHPGPGRERGADADGEHQPDGVGAAGAEFHA